MIVVVNGEPDGDDVPPDDGDILVPAGLDVVKPVTYAVDSVEPEGPVVGVPDGVPVDDAAEPTINIVTKI